MKQPPESRREADLHYCELAEAFLRKMRVMGPITDTEEIALIAVIARLRRYAEERADLSLNEVEAVRQGIVAMRRCQRECGGDSWKPHISGLLNIHQRQAP